MTTPGDPMPGTPAERIFAAGDRFRHAANDYAVAMIELDRSAITPAREAMTRAELALWHGISTGGLAVGDRVRARETAWGEWSGTVVDVSAYDGGVAVAPDEPLLSVEDKTLSVVRVRFSEPEAVRAGLTFVKPD